MSVATVLVWTAYLGPLLAMTAPNGLAPLLVLVVLGVGVTLWREKRVPAIALAPALLLGGMVLWGLVTLLWSLEPVRGIVTVGRLLFMLGGGIVVVGAARALDGDDRRRVGRALCYGVFIALVLFGVETLSGGLLERPIRAAFGLPEYRPYFHNRAASLLVIWMWPALMALRAAAGMRACLVGLAVGMVALAGAESTAAALAAAAGLVVAIPGLLDRGAVAMRRLLTAGILIAVLGGPAYSVGLTLADHHKITNTAESSMFHRLYIWDFVARKIREKPILGWGLESSKAIPGGHTNRPVPPGLSYTDTQISYYKTQLLPLHPHNAGLQVWVELGLPGVLLFTGFLMWLLWTIGRRVASPAVAGLCLAQVTGTFVIAEVSYGIWQSWWVSTIVLGLAFTVALQPAADEAGQAV